MISVPGEGHRGKSRGVRGLLAAIALGLVSAVNLWFSTATSESLAFLVPIWLTLGMAGLIAAFGLSRNQRWAAWLALVVVIGSVMAFLTFVGIFAASFEELGDGAPLPSDSP